jgi:hypothetical protein
MGPVARATGVVVRDLGDETIVYDAERHEAHCLNRTAALVFCYADGRSVVDIAAAVTSACRSVIDEETVRLALSQLAAARLLWEGEAEPASPAPSPTDHGRREVLRRAALGAALLTPAVLSLVVPTPAQAAATCIPQSACTAAKYGQPCYQLSQSECTSKVCIDTNLCQ